MVHLLLIQHGGIVLSVSQLDDGEWGDTDQFRRYISQGCLSLHAHASALVLSILLCQSVNFQSLFLIPSPTVHPLLADEIPQGLQLMANGAGHTLLLNGEKPVQKRVLVSSVFRLIVGYLFLSSLFINIAQNSNVIEVSKHWLEICSLLFDGIDRLPTEHGVDCLNSWQSQTSCSLAERDTN